MLLFNGKELLMTATVIYVASLVVLKLDGTIHTKPVISNPAAYSSLSSFVESCVTNIKSVAEFSNTKIVGCFAHEVLDISTGKVMVLDEVSFMEDNRPTIN
jgi:hypothetical protein